ncbi:MULTISPECIES: hypothetical protein [Pseudomonas syringae group]|uniref:Uncharacterized protein n=1 Tax=Pseudomonas coronafaciens pv. striafaciens TaxID=235276 RepID=A0A3M4YLD0_9PSED|nr:MULTISPECIES: hypothetical protein [Pseudomonas syringae group]MDP5165558.1 hypothetical protein [Pseudomonas syringae pv. aptata str. DSM 50252]RMO51118.1 hypothetical protein ALQ40_00474 [Pseudomonas syringae]RMR88852.1 hypothetical protein ALP78_02971 [Pseudomonas coronafaciens pv. striafaciens]
MSNEKMRGELLAAFEAHKSRIATAMIGGGEGTRVRQVLERVSLSDFEAGWQASREALRNNQSFSDAFYEVSGLLGVTGARPEAPLVVFRQEVVPALQAVIRNSRRYEWLRAETGDGPNIQVSEWIGPHEYRLFGEELDQAIDQHLSQEAAQ